MSTVVEREVRPQRDFFALLLGLAFATLFLAFYFGLPAFQKIAEAMPVIPHTSLNGVTEMAEVIDAHRSDEEKLKAQISPRFEITFHRRDIDDASMEFWKKHVDDLLQKMDSKLKPTTIEHIRLIGTNDDKSMIAHVIFSVENRDASAALQDVVRTRAASFDIGFEGSNVYDFGDHVLKYLDLIKTYEEIGGKVPRQALFQQGKITITKAEFSDVL